MSAKMTRAVKHFSLHRIAATELRVVSDVDTGVLSVIQIEENVIREYARQGDWPHTTITLFILEDMGPLVRSLHNSASSLDIDLSGQDLSARNVAALDGRPVVNVYDLADLSTCNVFINRKAMLQANFWNDPLALHGLLAHEHGHPLAENEVTRASRHLKVELTLEPHPSLPPLMNTRLTAVLNGLVDKLCLYAPREVFANEVTIRHGFIESLLYLEHMNIDNASRSIAGRAALAGELKNEVERGTMTSLAADLLLFIGDLDAHLPLALEIAPFYRAGHPVQAEALEKVLATSVFASLDFQVAQVFNRLRDDYLALHTSLSQFDLIAWSCDTLEILLGALAEKGLLVHYNVQTR